MSQSFEFDAVIENGSNGGAYVRIPFDVEATFGKRRVKISATIDGEPYRGLLVRMGEPSHILLILKSIREKIGKTIGQSVHITLQEDIEPRILEIPPALIEAFEQAPEALAFFNALSYTHRREYIQWIESAKLENTKLKRVAKTIEMLNNKQKDPNHV